METISHNTDKNGIEISFDYHVTDETKAWFRSNAFRWSKRGNVWWRPFSEEMWTKVHEYFKHTNTPVIKPNTTCDICGKSDIKKYGLGAHKRQAHGIVFRRVMKVTNKQGEVVERVSRPSGHVPVMVKEQRIEQVVTPRNNFMTVNNGEYVIISSPYGTDISTMLNLRLGYDSIIKQINGLPDDKRNSFTIKRVPIKQR